MKKTMLLFLSSFGLLAFSNLANAEEEYSYVPSPSEGYFTREINPDEVEVFDDQGNLVDKSEAVFIEHIPMFQSRAGIDRKYVTTKFTYNSMTWPQSHYLRWSGGWQGTVFYKSYTTMAVLWGTSYRVTYAGSLFRW